jgi:predicted nucleic acid-binding Zn ribbon protein
MGRYGGTYDARYSRRELRQRNIRVLSYFLISALAVATVVVVLMALRG